MLRVVHQQTVPLFTTRTPSLIISASFSYEYWCQKDVMLLLIEARLFNSIMLSDNMFDTLHISNTVNCLHRDFIWERVLEVVSELNKLSHLAIPSLYVSTWQGLYFTGGGSAAGWSTWSWRASLLFGNTSNLWTTSFPVTTGFMYDVLLW